MDESFPHSYACEAWREITATPATHYYYPGASTEGGRDGLWLAIRPNGGDPWFGTFAFGRSGASGVFTTPSPHKLCVVASGTGYIVDAREPTRWEEVRVEPITDVRPAPARGVLVFADFVGLTAYGADGITWESQRLAWDGLKITDVTDSTLHGQFDNLGGVQSFTVDLATGADEGGLDSMLPPAARSRPR